MTDPITEAARGAVTPVPPVVWVVLSLWKKPEGKQQTAALAVVASLEEAKAICEWRIVQFAPGAVLEWASPRGPHVASSQTVKDPSGTAFRYSILEKEVGEWPQPRRKQP